MSAEPKRRAHFDVRFYEWAPQALGKATFYVGTTPVAYEISRKLKTVLLKKQDGGAATRAIETLWLSLLQEQIWCDWTWLVVTSPAVALENVAYHQRHNLNHSDKTDLGAVWDVGVYDGNDALILGIGKS